MTRSYPTRTTISVINSRSPSPPVTVRLATSTSSQIHAEVLKAHFTGRLERIANHHSLLSSTLLKEVPAMGTFNVRNFQISLPFNRENPSSGTTSTYQPPPVGLRLPEPTIKHTFVARVGGHPVIQKNSSHSGEPSRRRLSPERHPVSERQRPTDSQPVQRVLRGEGSLVTELRSEIRRLEGKRGTSTGLERLKILEQTARTLSSDSLTNATLVVLPRSSSVPRTRDSSRQVTSAKRVRPAPLTTTISPVCRTTSPSEIQILPESPLSRLPDELLHLISQFVTPADGFRFAFACGRQLPQLWGVAAVVAHGRVNALQARCERQALLVSIALEAQKVAQKAWEDRVRERDEAVLAADAIVNAPPLPEDNPNDNHNPGRINVADGTEGIRVLEALQEEQKALQMFQGSVGVLEIVMAQWSEKCNERDKAMKENGGLKKAIRVVFLGTEKNVDRED